MVAAQFESVGADATADLNKVLSMNGVEAVSYDDMFTSGAEIQVLDGSSYKYYYYINDALDENDNDVEGDVWADADGYVVTEADVLALGDGFWFHVRGSIANASITVAGQVSDATEMTKEIVGDASAKGVFNMIANPYPIATDLASVKTTGLVAVGYDDMFATGNEIQVLDGISYKYYYYINDALDENDNDVEGDVWADGDGYIVSEADLIPAGQSFWVRGRQNGSMTFSIAK